MDLGLRGRRALITGGSRGIGFAVAEALAAEGAAVGLVARDAAGLAQAAGRLEPRGVPVATAAADVTDTPALQRAVTEIASALGGLDHLVANAGGTVGTGNLTSAADDEFTATFALNAGHAVELIRAGRPHLQAAGGGAEIGRLTLQPGWRWSDHVKPLAGTELCEAPHFQYHVAGTLHVVMADGAEFDARPGDVTALPQGHDAWVVGDEPVVVVDWYGASNYARG